MGVEELLIQRIENDLRGLRLKTKKMDEVSEMMKTRLERLKKTNPDLAFDLESKYHRLTNLEYSENY
jgi:hypothetical protein